MMERKELEYFVDDIGLMGVGETEFKLIKSRADIRVKSILPYVRGKRVLDMGCGSGYASDKYSEVSDSLVAVDMDEDAIKFGRTHYPNVTFIQQDILKGFKGNVFDVVVSTEVLEHLPSEDWDVVLQNVYDVLDVGGMFVGTIPVEGNTYSWGSHKARYDRSVFDIQFKKYFGDGLVSIIQFPWYYPSYFFRFIKEDK